MAVSGRRYRRAAGRGLPRAAARFGPSLGFFNSLRLARYARGHVDTIVVPVGIATAPRFPGSRAPLGPASSEALSRLAVRAASLSRLYFRPSTRDPPPAAVEPKRNPRRMPAVILGRSVCVRCLSHCSNSPPGSPRYANNIYSRNATRRASPTSSKSLVRTGMPSRAIRSRG